MTPVTTFAKGNEILASSDTKVISKKENREIIRLGTSGGAL